MMKLKWNDVKPFFEDNKVWANGLEMYWYQLVWQLLDENNLTNFHSLVEKLAVYSRLNAIIRIYNEFYCAVSGESGDFCVYFDAMSADEEKQGIYEELIKDGDTMQTIFTVLKTTLGREKTYCALWVTCHDEDLEESQIDTYESYVNALNGDMNGILKVGLYVDKLASYEWLSNYM
jgi:hypothetical protein